MVWLAAVMAQVMQALLADEAHYLTDDEFAVLGRALDDMEAGHPVAVAALRFG